MPNRQIEKCFTIKPNTSFSCIRFLGLTLGHEAAALSLSHSWFNALVDQFIEFEGMSVSSRETLHKALDYSQMDAFMEGGQGTLINRRN